MPGILSAHVRCTSDPVKAVEKKDGSPRYSPSSATSEDEDEIYEEPLKKTVEEPPKKSPTNAVTNTVKPVEKKDGSPSYSPSPPKSQDGEKILEKHGYIVVDPPEKSPTEAVENTGGFDWYQLTDKDKDRFIDKVNRHASSLTLT